MLGLARGGHVTPERVRALTPWVPHSGIPENLWRVRNDSVQHGDPRRAERVAAAARGRTGEIGVMHLLSEVMR
jgi:hypothetical protein